MADKVIVYNMVGTFVFDNQLKVVESQKGDKRSELLSRYKNAAPPNEKQRYKLMEFFKDKQYFSSFRNQCIKITKADIKNAVDEAMLIGQAIASADELERVINMLTKRLREWFALTAPEVERSMEDNRKFVEAVLKKPREMLLKEVNTDDVASAGKLLSPEDVKAYQNLAWQITQLHNARSQQESYIISAMEKSYPNLTQVATALVGARLLQHAGTMKRLAKMPASTLQMLGAEKAMFRHLRNKAKCASPKYGLIYNHPVVQSVKPKNRGKMARILADKICIAVKVDYFKGVFIGGQLRNMVAEKARALE
jgi:nucleolar protein 56